MKRTSSLIIILVLVALAGVSIYLYFSKSRFSTVNEDDRNFKFKDTASITKIFLADKDKNRSTIVRTPKGWIVNDKYPCRSDAILNLLEAIKLVEVKMSVPKESKPHVIKFMSFNAVKVEIYAGDEKVKQYYVGHETPDNEGSYMLLSDPETGRNFKDPYICFIPGFFGFLAPRYITNENEWRDRIVINYIPPQIKAIKVEHSDNPADSSFVIELKDANSFALKNMSGRELPFDVEKLRQYLIYYQNISYEVLISGQNMPLQDSIARQKPFATITVINKNSKNDIFRLYRKPFTGDQAVDHGVKYEYDPNRFYLRFGNGDEWALAQYFVFGKLLATPKYFVAADSVKK